MADLKHLIENKEYQQILELEGVQYDRFKVTCLIHLERYRDALILMKKMDAEHTKQQNEVGDKMQKMQIKEKMSGDMRYEKAYALYKLKKYKKSLSILKRMEASERVNVLLSQVYYFLRSYRKAYNTLSKCKYEKERDVNLCAMDSLSRISLRRREDDEQIHHIELKPGHLAGQMAYNSSFRDFHFYDPEGYVHKYKNVSNGYIQEQIANLIGCVDLDKLSKKKRKIAQYNLNNDPNFKKYLLHRNRDSFKKLLLCSGKSSLKNARVEDEHLMRLIEYIQMNVDEKVSADILKSAKKSRQE
ncbi:hypothetical protein THOM_2614 [Trachipleistophora hominis]|uniref:Uncharacterized protein n=1 Tax=Trachipleistophora hominis TaxID=72359 RepID=L7JUM2_TRAHO|nr:hypothetical protein THOM_2614 [Trachipleistophora hominis]